MSATAKPCIMLVDDDEHIRMTLGDFLTFEGFEVVLTRSGRDALQKLETVKPDLILLDIMMPGMDGGDVAQALQNHPRWSKIPLIYVTAAVSRKEASAHGGVIGGQLILPKPIDLDELLGHIRRLVPASRTPPAPPSTGTSGSAWRDTQISG